MTQERRENQRTEIERSVILNADRISPHFCQIRNISMNGLYVELAEHNFRRDMPVNLVVTIAPDSSSDSGKIVRWTARVARVTDQGIGLRLEEMDVDAMGAILALVYPG